MSKMTQCQRVIDYMNTHGSITQGEAYHISVARLASRINDLKNDGYVIKREMIRTKNQYGEPCRFARYSLIQ